MKIARLKLENYRLHLDTEIEFPDGVTAVIGRNGAGKSTILEAIGFGLYGTGATRTNKHLIKHHDAPPTDPVRVELEFELGGQAVRVVRELRGKNLAPHATVEVDGKPLVASGGNSNGAATEELTRLLGMDRSAFFSTLASHQKDLARLAELPAADRKKLILKMLGIDGLDRAIEHAREKRKVANATLEGMRSALPSKEHITARRTEAEDAVAQATKFHAAEKAAHDEVAQKLSATREEAEALGKAVAERAAAESRLHDRERELAHLEQDLRGVHDRMAEAEGAASQAERLGDTTKERATAEHDVDRIRTLHRAAEQRASQLEALKKAQQTLTQAQQKFDSVTIPDDIPLEPYIREATRFDAALRESRDAWMAISHKLDEIRDQHRRLRDAAGEAECPVCQRPLGDHLESLHADLNLQRTQAQKKVADALEAMEETERRAKQAHADLDEARQRHEQRSERLADQRVAQADLEAAERAFREAQRSVPPESGDLPDLDLALKALDRARKREMEHARLTALAEDLPRMRAQEEVLRRGVEVAKAETARATTMLRKTTDERDAWVATKASVEELTSKERALHTTALQAQSRLDMARQALENAARRLADWKDQREHIRTQEQTVREWEALAGGRGRGLLEAFRSHLVSKIRPAINEEASRLLASFTRGKYTEMMLDEDYGLFVSQDNRPYTLDRFSGGESDLVHLALRLAVSRLLTQRAGAPELRFLALDEVFGSLDDERRHDVVAALHGLTTLYSQVLVVTHQEGLRDALDAVIEVHDDEHGAKVVIHQG